MESEYYLVQVKCQRCKHVWVPRTSKIKMCAKCKSRLWNVKKVLLKVKK